MLVPLLRLLAAGAALVAQSSNAATTTTISLPTGAKVTGLIEANGQRNVQVFRGVPYAEPPIGDKRWKPSTLKTPSGNIDATAYGDACVPFGASGAQPKSSENCLFLNVFTPVGVTSTSKRPVMVWIHGGALLNGNSNSYDPRGIVAAANDQVVLVTLNYRLGSFGFLSSKQILAEGNGANFGLRDQEVALQWVQKYIEHFGGDSTNITVFGNSAGSWSIGHHFTSRDGNQKLFQRAILTSGAYSTVHDTPPPAVSQSKADAIARAVGCNANAADVLACMRRAGTSAIAGVSIPNSRGFPWMPTVDGVFMLDTAINRLRAGKVSRVPTITGTTADEGWMFTSWVQQTSQFDSFLRSQFSMLTEDEYRQVAALYPASSFQTLRHRTGEIYGDAIFVCPTEQLSATLANDVTYRYRYSVTSNEGGFQLGLHGSDVGNMFSQGGTSAVTKYYQQFFTNFARTGTPTDARQWPRFTNATKQQLVIQPTLALETMGSQRQGHVERCAFWLKVEQRIANAVKFF